MSSFTLAPADQAEWTRLAEIQQAAFKAAGDPIDSAALGNVSKNDYIEWIIKGLENLSAPPGYRIEIVTARDGNNNIAGWAQWMIPSETSSDMIGKSEVLEQVSVQVPQGGNEQIWSEFLAASSEYEKKYLGDRTHWSRHISTVHR
jgi:hypothetical protein